MFLGPLILPVGRVARGSLFARRVCIRAVYGSAFGIERIARRWEGGSSDLTSRILTSHQRRRLVVLTTDNREQGNSGVGSSVHGALSNDEDRNLTEGPSYSPDYPFALAGRY